MLKKIITASTVSGVLLIALLANQHPITELTPQAETVSAQQLTQTIERPTTKPIQEFIPVTKTFQVSKEVPIIETTTEIKVTVTPTEKCIISSPSNSPKPTTKNGNKKDGYVWVEGFGYIENNGGGNQVTFAHDMYENGNKVGIMDGEDAKIGDKVWVEGFGYVEYGGPNFYSKSYSTGSFDIMVGNTGVPVGKPKPKEPVEEYIPQAGDVQTDINTGITSIYVEGQGFVPMSESEDENNG